MTLLVCGLNHHSAPLALREQVASRAKSLSTLHTAVLQAPFISELLPLATCNRSEWFAVVQKTAEMGSIGASSITNDTSTKATEQFCDWVCAHYQIEPDTWRRYGYVYTDQAAIKHVLRVASGLDSMVLGEPQILGQIKQAYQQAKQAHLLGPHLDKVLQFVFSTTKSVRTELGLSEHGVSVAAVAVNLAVRIFSELANATVLLVGAGDTIELVAQHMHQQGVKQLLIANRNVENAQRIARRYQGKAISLPQLPQQLHQADIVVSATGRSLPIIGKGMVEQALRLRQHQPMCMLDLAVPRDIEAEVRALHDVYLYDLDDLQAVIAESQKHRQRAADLAESLLEQYSIQFLDQMRARQATPAISAYRQHHQAIAQRLLDEALNALLRGEAADSVVKTLTHRLTNTFLHEPSVRLRQAGLAGDVTLLKHIEKLFLGELQTQAQSPDPNKSNQPSRRHCDDSETSAHEL